jgi:hypothetical protein
VPHTLQSPATSKRLVYMHWILSYLDTDSLGIKKKPSGRRLTWIYLIGKIHSFFTPSIGASESQSRKRNNSFERVPIKKSFEALRERQRKSARGSQLVVCHGQSSLSIRSPIHR